MSQYLVGQIHLGANAKLQGISFLICFAIGVVSGIVALAYFTRLKGLERILIDLIATLLIGGLFIVCIEFFMDGKIELYCIVAFLMGTVIIPLIYRTVKNYKNRKNQRK